MGSDPSHSVSQKHDQLRVRRVCPHSARRDCLRHAATLREAGIESPERDARLLAAAALGIEPARSHRRARIVRFPTRRLCDSLSTSRRRLQREPVSRILGSVPFTAASLPSRLRRSIPRPDTETLVDLALEIADEQGWRTRPIRIVDIGTGSGCILLTLLAELPLAQGLGTDIDLAALEMAASERLPNSASTIVCSSCTRGHCPGSAARSISWCRTRPIFPHGDISALEPEVRHYDPRGALDGGPDGLDIYRETRARPPLCSAARLVRIRSRGGTGRKSRGNL